VFLKALLAVFFACSTVTSITPIHSASSNDAVIHQPTATRFTVRLSTDGRLVNWWDTVLNVDIFLDSSDMELSGFDFLVAYNTASLYNPVVTLSPTLTNSDSGFGWQTFDYTASPAGELVSVCASDILRITAQMGANGSQSPGKPLPPVAKLHPLALARIQFYIRSQDKYYCSQLPDGAVRFLWLDCRDNQLVSGHGDTIFVGMNQASRALNQDEFVAEYPSYHGIQKDPCTEQLHSPVVNGIDFINGGLSLHCADSGYFGPDIDQDEITFGESDALLFAQYFHSDTVVFTRDLDMQRAETDVNGDGTPLMLADLVLLQRVICGDARGWACQIRTVRRLLRHENNILSIDKPVGAALFHIKGNVTPTLIAPEMELLHHFDGVNTRILIWSPPGVCGKQMSGEILKVKGKLVRWEFATYDGYKVHAELQGK
jgi:hypothetical protein